MYSYKRWISALCPSIFVSVNDVYSLVLFLAFLTHYCVLVSLPATLSSLCLLAAVHSILASHVLQITSSLPLTPHLHTQRWVNSLGCVTFWLYVEISLGCTPRQGIAGPWGYVTKWDRGIPQSQGHHPAIGSAGRLHVPTSHISHFLS